MKSERQKADGICTMYYFVVYMDTSIGATHRGTHKFAPRHHDELSIDIGDSIHVLNEADDGWCLGKNFRMMKLKDKDYVTHSESYK